MSTEKDKPKVRDALFGGIAPLGFVKGGTATSKSEQLYEQRFQEAEQRRDAQAAEEADAVRLEAQRDMDAALAQAAVEGQGVVSANQFTRHPEIPKAYIPLSYVNSKGEPIVIDGQEVLCQADLIVGMDSSRPTELTLIFVCPRCMQQGQKHEQDCQIQMRQSNKHFEFVAGKGPKTFIHMGKTFRSAGMIIESEPFRCPDCGWRARISENRVWPD
jgi:predicted RNA-binding Zn-ribbon protein involved in translation (DUF1610 family)